MRVRNKHLFVSALTGKGFCSYWEEVLADLRHLYLLQGGGTGSKSLFLRLLGLALGDRGYQVTSCHLPDDQMAIEGILVNELGCGIVDGDSPGIAGGSFPEGLPISEWELRDSRPNEKRLPNREEAVNLLEQAGVIWERITSANRICLPAEAVREQARGLTAEILTRPSHLKHYFAGTVAAEGPVDFTTHLTVASRKRYFISGEPGTGKRAMEEILTEALSRHYQVEAYHSYLNPDDLVLLLFPEIAVAVVDGTSCPRLQPQPGDLIRDLREAPGSKKPSKERATGEEEVLALLTRAGQSLGEAQLEMGAEALTSEEEMGGYISRLLKENEHRQRLAGR